jgi:hypothetical protein
MKTFAANEKRSALAARKARPYVHHPMGPVQQGRQVEIRRILRSTGAQAKLTIGQPNDKYEQEADRVADQVMTMPDPKLQRQPENDEEEETIQAKPLAVQITSLVQRQEEPPAEEEELQTKALDGMVQRQVEAEEDETLQTKSAIDHPSTVGASTHARIQSLKGSGQPLPPNQRAFYESRMGHDFSGVRIHAGTQAVDTAQSVQARAFTLGNNIVFNKGQYSPNNLEGKKLLAHELTHVVQQSGKAAPANLQRKVDFEFDLNYGTEKSAPATSSKANGAQVWSKSPITTHKRQDAAGVMKDGFKVVQDGNRIEITTMRFGIGTNGRAHLTKTMENIMAFVSDLESGCTAAGRSTVARPADSVTTKPLGKPRFSTTGFSVLPGRVFFPLGSKTYFRKSCYVSASPQATLDVPLGSVDPLVTEIKKSKGKPSGVALTGAGSRRAGVKSKALFDAQKAVNRSRKSHIDGGTTLADGTRVTSANFTDNLQGFMILMVSYLRTSEITYGSRDYEAFAKAYPPIVTHTRFRDMFHRILTSEERKVFIKLYGSPGVRNDLYALAGRSAGGGSRDLFPPRATIQSREFTTRPTWDDLVNKTITDTPLLNIRASESLFTPLAGATGGPTRAGKKKETSRFGPLLRRLGIGGKKKRSKIGARLELRRIGFAWVRSNKWKGLTTKIFELAQRLNNGP